MTHTVQGGISSGYPPPAQRNHQILQGTRYIRYMTCSNGGTRGHMPTARYTPTTIDLRNSQPEIVPRLSPIARNLLRDVGAPPCVEALQPLGSRYLTDAAHEVRVHARHYSCHDNQPQGATRKNTRTASI